MLLHETEFISEKEAISMLADCDEVIRILTSIIKSKLQFAPNQIVMEDFVEYGMSYDDNILEP